MPDQIGASIIRARKNVFLDFLSPENHVIYGADRNLPMRQLTTLLRESLNVAVLLAGDYCLLPPFFPLQSDAVRSALESRRAFLATGAIRIPLRESSLTSFLDKKMVEYGPVKGLYTDLYERRARAFVENLAPSIIKRHATMGRQIAGRWEAGPDESPAWGPVTDALDVAEIEALRTAPHRLKEDGESVTWLGIKRFLSPAVSRATFEVNQALQHEYARIYIDEYNATIISGAPPKTTDLLLSSQDLSYDYLTFRRVLTSVGLWDAVRAMAAEQILALKYTRGFLDFMAVFDRVCQRASNRLEVIHFFARCYDDLVRLGLWQRHRSSALASLIPGVQWFCDKIQIADDLLYKMASSPEFSDLHSRIAGSSESTVGLFNRWRSQMRKVFVVHGRDHTVRDRIDLFLRDKGLCPVVMDREASSGRTLLEKFEELANECDYAIVIATPDDDLINKADDQPLRRLRQNVVLEIGYFWGKNGRRGKFSILLKRDADLDLPTDLDGLGYIAITEDLGETKLRLEQELRRAGVLPAA
jgi:predicted nucleotide-binding protein